MRELDGGLEENAEHILEEIDAALRRIDDGTYGSMRRMRQADRRGAASGRAVGDALHRRQARAGRADDASPHARHRLDVRLGSATNAVRPVSGRRALARGRQGPVDRAPRRSPRAAFFADQLTKQVVGRTLDVGESVDLVGPFSLHHLQNSGIAFGLFASRTTFVIAVTAVAVARMLVVLRARGSTASGPAGRARARARRQPCEPLRPRPPRSRDGLPRSRRLAGFQPRRHVHRRRRRRCSSVRSCSPTGRAGCTERAHGDSPLQGR